MLREAVLRLVEHEPLVYYLTLLLKVEFYQLNWTVHRVRYLHLVKQRIWLLWLQPASATWLLLSLTIKVALLILTVVYSGRTVIDSVLMVDSINLKDSCSS